MAKNLFEEYVDISTKSIYKYLKLIFKNSYDSEIAQVYVETYINSRYYNLAYKENNRVFYLRIKEALTKKMNQLLEENEKVKNRTEDYVTYRKKEKIIKDMFSSFDYIYFFDKLRNVEHMKRITSIDEVVDRLYQKRQEEYQIKEKIDTSSEFLRIVQQNMFELEEILERYFANNTFELKIDKHSGKNSLYNIELISNLKLPMIYSSAAINMAYNSENTKMERLLAEYMLLSLLVTRDIVECNFKDEYLVEFAPSIFKKKMKLNQTLETINNPALQEKINLKIKYQDFLKYKTEIFELMKNGYKFALVLDHDFEDAEEIKKLQMFSYIIVDRSLRCSKQIEKKYKTSDKIIYE